MSLVRHDGVFTRLTWIRLFRLAPVRASRILSSFSVAVVTAVAITAAAAAIAASAAVAVVAAAAVVIVDATAKVACEVASSLCIIEVVQISVVYV